MEYVKVDKEVLEGAITSMANTIRNQTNDSNLIKWDQTTGFSEPIAKACSEIFEDGKQEVLEEVEVLNDKLEQIMYSTDTGGKSYYDEFWDAYQEYGNKTFCVFMYAGPGWTPSNFKPKYVTKPVNGHRMFDYHNRSDSWDREEGVFPTEMFDFSNLTDASYIFQNARFSEVDVDLSNATNLNFAFQGSDGGRILHLSVKIITKQDMNHAFTYMEHILTFRLKEGSIIQHNGFNMQHSKKLDKESFVSIINALSKTTTGLTVTLSLAAVNRAFETSVGANDGEKSAEWNDLIADYRNWNISLS